MNKKESETLLHRFPQIQHIMSFFSDLNGIPRGKYLPKSQLDKVFQGGLRLPISSLCADVWGVDVPAMAMDTGDADAICLPTERGLLPVFWTEPYSAYLPVSYFNDDQTPNLADPRNALRAIVDRFRKHGFTPVVAVELEFYLVAYNPQDNRGQPTPPKNPLTNSALEFDKMHSVDELEQFHEFIQDVYQACDAQDVPADTALSEFGIGQFEINLKHVNDALKAADDAILFKRIVRGIARKHGFTATFMAKPYMDYSGNGCHVHFSLEDDDGKNIFDDGTEIGTQTLQFAIGGLLEAMSESIAIFAPHLNSYRRLVSESYAPTIPVWGYDNRTTAIRVPGGDFSARRIEHRVAGADVNPYLAVAAILGAALYGIENHLSPPPATEGNAYNSAIQPINSDWKNSLETLQTGNIIQQVFDPLLLRMFVELKKQEINTISRQITEFEIRSYLEDI